MLETFETVATDLDHPEAVALGPDGRLYAGGEAGQIYRIHGDGSVDQMGTTGGFIYGVTLDAGGDVYACDFGNASVVRVSPGGEVSTWSAGTPERPMRVPNFAAFDDAGNLYVTDSGEWGRDDGLVLRVAPDGSTVVWSQDVPRFPNGCCLSRDGDALLVVESHGREVVTIPIEDDGRAGRPRPVASLAGSQPDGIALAEDGTMVVGCYRPDRLYAIAPDGAVEVLAEDPDGVVLNQPANVAFVGERLDRIAVSSLGGWSIVAAPTPFHGLPLRYPAL
ncbi:MAG TPA: SMP-30/gluconolactonase/LRE family protein [Actinomycetota bacterium]|nr:SMP-30/gluconolactonase/LRE family protein [Actinomycetota bacterium]